MQAGQKYEAACEHHLRSLDGAALDKPTEALVAGHLAAAYAALGDWRGLQIWQDSQEVNIHGCYAELTQSEVLAAGAGQSA